MKTAIPPTESAIAPVTPEILAQFKGQVRTFIRWAKRENEGVGIGGFDDDIKAVTAASSFEEVQAILAKHDGGEFMDMVRSGDL